MKTITAWLFLSVACLAQTSAIIEGPSSALPGELVVLNSAKSVGDNHKWITPDGLSTAQAGCDAINSQVFFATPKQGVYEFVLIVTDKSAAIEFARHSVTIKTPSAPVDPPPTNPTDPTPPSNFGQLRDLSKANSVRLNDPATRGALAKNLRATLVTLKSQCESGQCPTLAGAQSAVVKSIEDTLLARARPTRGIDWELGWRTPNNAFISQQKITSVPVYLEAIAAITLGLE